CPTQRIEGRALVAALGAADAVVLVDLDDLTAHAAGDLAQFTVLVCSGLIERGNPQIKNGSAHVTPPGLCQNRITLCVENRLYLHTQNAISEVRDFIAAGCANFVRVFPYTPRAADSTHNCLADYGEG